MDETTDLEGKQPDLRIDPKEQAERERRIVERQERDRQCRIAIAELTNEEPNITIDLPVVKE